jgi:phage baseplate assembly protein V
MLKFGIVSNLDISNGQAKVYFEEDEMESAWLKISVMRSAPDQISFPFDINEHVWCLMDEHAEYGVIGGAIYDDENTPSGSAAGMLKITFGDNSVIQYNRNSHILSLDIKGDINVKSGGNITVETTGTGSVEIKATSVKIDALNTEITGALLVKGVAAVGGLTGASGGVAGGDIEAGDSLLKVKDIAAENDVIAGTISLQTHIHTSGGSGSPTSTPIP